MRNIVLLAATLCPTWLYGADRFVPAPYETQAIGGVLGERMRIDLEGRLLHVDEKAITEGFHTRPGTHAWIGEHAGKFLDAATNTWRFTRDERLKTLMDRIARSVIAGQLPDGYLGTYTDDKRWTSWDVWSHKYNLLGLLAYYDATRYAPALEASKKMGDLLIRTFGTGPGQRDIIAASTHMGMAATSVLEPICRLYRATGDRRYLDFARYLVASWEQPNGPKIVSSLLAHGNVFKTANAKAYEMMSCLVGLVELYRITGEQQYLKAAQAAWQDIASKRLYVSGTTSSHEHFTDDHKLPGMQTSDVGEGCATVTWLQLSWQLLRTTGDVKYAHELERTVYNQLLGAQDPHNGNICYFTPLVGRKQPGPGVNCCVSSEPRGISMIPQLAWGEKDGGIAMLLYAAGKVDAAGFKLRVDTRYPEDGKVTITVDGAPAGPAPVLLRVPQWTAGFQAKAGGRTLTGKPGDFLRIDRKWKAGDRIAIEVDMTVRVLDGGKSYPGYIALQRGPEVLALDRAKNPAIDGLHLAAFAEGSPKLKSAAPREYQTPGLVVRRDASGKPVRAAQDLLLVPFSDASSMRVWVLQPSNFAVREPSVGAYGAESFSRSDRSDGSIADERADTYRTTNRGKAIPEDWFAVEFDSPEKISRIVFRHGKTATDGGWFDTTAGKPRLQIRRTGVKEWETVGTLDRYPDDKSKLTDGAPFEVILAAPLEAAAIRVIGKPGGQYTSCAELQAFRTK